MDDENNISDKEVIKTVKSIEKIFKNFLKLLKDKWPDKIPTVVMFFNEDELCSGYVLRDKTQSNEEYSKIWVLHAKKYNPTFILNCSNTSSDDNPHDGRLIITHLGNQLVSHYLHEIENKSTEGWEEIW